MDLISIAYRTDLMIHQLSGSEISDRGSHLVVRDPSSPLAWWGNFLLLRPAVPGSGRWQEWLDEFAREFPSAQHVALGLDGTDGLVRDTEGLTALGLDVQVDTVLTASALSRAPALAPIEIRPLRTDEEWSQSVELRLSLHEGPCDPLLPERARARARASRALAEAGHAVWAGAFVDGVMRCGAGLVIGDGGLGRFQSVETHPAFRRRGLASALVHRLGTWGLTDLGASKLVIVADPGYHAIGLYRQLGFQDEEHQVRFQRPRRL